MVVSEEAGFQKVRAWGPGLKTGMVGKSADFVVEAIGTDVGTLGEPCANEMSSYRRREIFLCVLNVKSERFHYFDVQASPSKAHHRLKLSVMIRAMAPVMCAIGPPRPGTMPSMSFVTTRTSKTAPSWPTSFLQPMTSSLKR